MRVFILKAAVLERGYLDFSKIFVTRNSIVFLLKMSVISFSMLNIRYCTLNLIGLLLCGNSLIWFLDLNLIWETLWIVDGMWETLWIVDGMWETLWIVDRMWETLWNVDGSGLFILVTEKPHLVLFSCLNNQVTLVLSRWTVMDESSLEENVYF